MSCKWYYHRGNSAVLYPKQHHSFRISEMALPFLFHFYFFVVLGKCEPSVDILISLKSRKVAFILLLSLPR